MKHQTHQNYGNQLGYRLISVISILSVNFSSRPVSTSGSFVCEQLNVESVLERYNEEGWCALIDGVAKIEPWFRDTNEDQRQSRKNIKSV